MPDNENTQDQNEMNVLKLQFGEEMTLEEAGFSFCPLHGFELEVDGSVYMYSEDGHVEISMIGGELENETTIAELNDQFAADFMENFDEFSIMEAGKDAIQGITGFLSRIHFINAEEKGIGRAFICSPHINQFFFLLVISSAEYWEHIGSKVFNALKNEIHFHAQFKTTKTIVETDAHPDLTIEICESIPPTEDLVITIEKGDVSLLVSARTRSKSDQVVFTQILAPDGEVLYQYNPSSATLQSSIIHRPLISNHGELCFYFPTPTQQTLTPGDYKISFTTRSGRPLQETQVIIRQQRSAVKQMLDFNVWLALDHERFSEENALQHFEANLQNALSDQLKALEIMPGKVHFNHPSPDELVAFSSVNQEYDLPDCSYMMAESFDENRALNVALVEHITQADPPIESTENAVSSGSPGMILSTASPHSCVVVKYAPFEHDFNALAHAIIEQLIVFTGAVETPQTDQPDSSLVEQFLSLAPEIRNQRLKHPIFYPEN